MDSMTFGKTMPVADLPEEVTKQKQATFPPNLDVMIQNSKLDHAIEDIISYLDIYNEIFNEAYRDLRFYSDYIKYDKLYESEKRRFRTYIASLKTTMEEVDKTGNELEKIAAQIPVDNIKANELINRLKNECVRVGTRGIIAIISMENFANNGSKTNNNLRHVQIKFEETNDFDKKKMILSKTIRIIVYLQPYIISMK